MGFMDSYKRLEKLCGDMLEDERRISAYIDDIEWVEDFYYRIIDGEDPLSRYYKIVRARNSINNASRYGMDTSSYGKNSNSSCSSGILGTILLALFIAVVLFFMILEYN